MQSLRLRFLLMMVLLLVCACSSALAQPPQQQPACTLKEAPKLHGFRLGMTAAEVKKSLADSSAFDSKLSSENTVGSRAVNIRGSELSDENGEGVESVYLTFFEERVAHIKVTYNGAARWDGSQDFFVRTSASLGLPSPAGPEAFEGNGENAKYIVRCGEFNAILAYSFGVSPNVTVSNMLARKTVDKRRDKQEQGRREVLRPIPSPFPRRDPMPPQTGEPHPSKP
jgi:hypothetical protein